MGAAGIKFGSWNICRGTHSKESEIRSMVDAHAVDVLFLQEIDLLDYSDGSFKLPGYSTYVHGGKKKRVCTLVRQNLFRNVCELPEESSESSQVWLQVEEMSGRKTTLANIYREWTPKGKTPEEVLSSLKVRAEQCGKSGNFVMAGDFNLDPTRQDDPSYSSKTLCNDFLNHISEAGLHRHSFGVTFYRKRIDKDIHSELDWVISNCSISQKLAVRSGMSDHALLLWTLNHEVQKSEIPRKLGLRNFNKVNPTAFANELGQQPWEELAFLSIDAMAECFNELFLCTLDNHAPLRYVKQKTRRTAKPSKKLEDLRRQRDNARSKGQKEKLKKLRNQCNKLARKEAIEDVRRRIDRGGEEWKVVRELTGQGGTNSATIKQNGQVLTPVEAAATFNHHFITKVEKIRANISEALLQLL